MWKIISKTYTVFIGILLILASVWFLLTMLRLNAIAPIPMLFPFVGFLGTILLSVLGCYLIFATIINQNKVVVKETKDTYYIWLTERIVELQTEYNEINAYVNTPEFQIKLVKGGKLKGYKEIRDYIETH